MDPRLDYDNISLNSYGMSEDSDSSDCTYYDIDESDFQIAQSEQITTTKYTSSNTTWLPGSVRMYNVLINAVDSGNMDLAVKLFPLFKHQEMGVRNILYGASENPYHEIMDWCRVQMSK